MVKTERLDKNVTKSIKKSSEKFKQMYPVLVDANGELIDGQHRSLIFKNPDKRKLDFIKTKKQRLEARLVANHARKGQNKKTWEYSLDELALILEREGIEKIGMSIASETGLPYRTIMRYLPSKYKDEAQSKRASHPRMPHGNQIKGENKANSSGNEKVEIEGIPMVNSSRPALPPSIPEKVPPEKVLEDLKSMSGKTSPKIEVKSFANQTWKAIILPKDFYTSLSLACEKHRLDMEEVITLALMKLLDNLRRKKSE